MSKFTKKCARCRKEYPIEKFVSPANGRMLKNCQECRGVPKQKPTIKLSKKQFLVRGNIRNGYTSSLGVCFG